MFTGYICCFYYHYVIGWTNGDARLLHYSPDEELEHEGEHGTFKEKRAGEDEPQLRDHRMGTGEGHFITQVLVNMRHAAAASPLYTVFVSLMLGSGSSVQRQAAAIKAEPDRDTRRPVQTKRLATCIKVIKDQI